MMPAIFSKVKRSSSKPSSLPPSPSTTTEGAVRLHAPSLPPATPRSGHEDVSFQVGSPEDPLAFLELVDNANDAAHTASAQADLSTVHENEGCGASPMLHTIVEESESRGSSPAVSLTAEQARGLLTTINDVVVSSTEAIEGIHEVDGCLNELEEDQFIDKSGRESNAVDRGNTGQSSNAESELAHLEVTVVSPRANSTEDAIDDVADDDVADDEGSVYHDAEDMSDAETPTNGKLGHDEASIAAVEEYGSDDDEGSSVYSFATTAPSFAGDENVAPPMVSSPFWSERASRVNAAANSQEQPWNPAWTELQTPVGSTIDAQAEVFNNSRALGADQVAPTAAPFSLHDDSQSQQENVDEGDHRELILFCKKEEQAAEDGGEEVRTADVVVESLGCEKSEQVEVLLTPPTDEVDAAILEPTTASKAPTSKLPTSYVPTFTGVPRTVTTGVSYRQLSVELNTEPEGHANFYQVALQKLKQERQLRRLNPTVMKPVMSAPSSNSSVYDGEDEDERRARLSKIEELRKRTSEFVVKIGKPIPLGRLPYSKS